MISLNEIVVRFGGFELFNNISLTISDGEKVALVGRNGSGKSTLLKLLMGIEKPEMGRVEVPKNMSVGYLPQQMKTTNDRSVLEETLSTFSEMQQLQHDIDLLNNQIKSRTDTHTAGYLKLIEKLSITTEKLHDADISKMIAETERTLKGLGFRDDDLKSPTSTLSGGWRMRIELAKILLRQPGLLLLDEPTNHLDIESIMWLEQFLTDYPGALLLISHDRAFLDQVTNRTVEIYLGELHDYDVSYSRFIELRNERREHLIAAYRNQQKYIEKTEAFIERFRYKNTKAVQVQSRIKQLEKLDRIEIEEYEKDIKFRFPPASRSGDVATELVNVGKKFGHHLVFQNVNLTLTRGEKIAFVGRNGEGKTTLAKILVGDLDHIGTVKLGHQVTIGYYAQNQDELLDESKTVLQTIDDIAQGDIRTRIRGLLGAFLFRDDDVDKKVSVLSGGERSRLSLIKLLLKPHSLLILDEPTNHLDLASKDILKKALQDYNGTLILVSHDRYFLSDLVEKVYEFKDQNVKEYLGGINDFLSKRRLGSLQELERYSVPRQKLKVSEPGGDNRASYLKKKIYDKELRKIRNKLQRLEEEIDILEKSIEEKERILSQPEILANESFAKDFYNDYDAMKKKLDHKVSEWEKVSYELEITEMRGLEEV